MDFSWKKVLSQEQIRQAKLIRRRFVTQRRKDDQCHILLSLADENACLREIGVMYNDMEGDNKKDTFVPFHPRYYEIQTVIDGEHLTFHRNIMQKRCCSMCDTLKWVKMYDLRTKKEIASNYVECYKCKALTKFPDHVLIEYGLFGRKKKIVNRGRAKRGW